MSHTPRVLALLAALMTPVTVQAAVTITAPTPGQRLVAAQDYATEVLGDPWDMSNREDYSLYEPGENSGFSTLGLDGSGRLMGTLASDDASIGILYRGFYGAVNPGRNGRRFPIAPTTYAKLAFKLSSSVSGQEPQVYWYHYPHSHPTGWASYGALILSGQSTVVGSRIFVIDLTSGNHGEPAEHWTAGPVLGLRIDPNSTGASVGQQTGLDWVRLVPADGQPGSPALSVQWTGPAGTYTLTAEELGATAATPVTITASATGSAHTWSYGFLPPGSYRLTVSRNGAPADTASVDVAINAPPLLHVTEPDETGDGDFATTALGNPWDMSDPADVVRVDQMVDGGTFAGGQFTATSVSGEIGRDSQVWLMMNPSHPTPRIDPARYHRLTYRYTLDGPFNPGNGGSVARVLWGAAYDHSDRLASTEDIITWAGATSYTIDLATLGIGEDAGIEPGSTGLEPWSDGAKRFFRLDPHEGATGRTFHLDDVRIATDDQPAGTAEFVVRWQWSDPDAGAPASVTLSHDTDEDPVNGMTLIAAGLSAAAGEYVWNTTGLANGVYHVYAEITDGTNTTARYATGPLRIGGFAETCGDCLDNDGNGLVDYEDPACCPQPTALRLTRARFLPGKGGIGLTLGRLNITAAVPDASFSSIDPPHEDVSLQFRNAGGELLCGTAAASRWTRRKKAFVFTDDAGVLVNGLRKTTLRVRNGGMDVVAAGRLIDVTRFFDPSASRNDLQLTVRVGARCAQGAAALRSAPKGRFGYP